MLCFKSGHHKISLVISMSSLLWWGILEKTAPGARCGRCWCWRRESASSCLYSATAVANCNCCWATASLTSIVANRNYCWATARLTSSVVAVAATGPSWPHPCFLSDYYFQQHQVQQYPTVENNILCIDWSKYPCRGNISRLCCTWSSCSSYSRFWLYFWTY